MEVRLVIGSIVEQEVDVIVNSANTDLVMGRGVAAAILLEAGPEVEEEAVRQGPLRVGDVVVTTAGNLGARHILHVAVVGDTPPDIYECGRNVLEKADELGARSIAFPALGTGSAGVSPRESARDLCRALADHAREGTALEEAVIVLWDDDLFPVFQRALARHFRR